MPLDCEQIRNEFSALLDDELNSEDRELVEEHLFDCSDCLRELHGYQQVSDAYRYHHPVKAPADFEDLLRERIAPAAQRRGLPARTWISLAAAAGVTLVAGIILYNKPLPEQASFQLSKNATESLETAPIVEELAPAPLDLDVPVGLGGGAGGSGSGFGGGGGTPDRFNAQKAADEPQMSAFSAAAPEADIAEAETAPEAQDALLPPAEPQMKQFDPTADSTVANENARALKSAPLATEADEVPEALSRAQVMRQRSMTSESADDAGDSSEAKMAESRTAEAHPETPSAGPAPVGPREMSVASALPETAPANDETAAAEPARTDGESAIQWRERTFTLQAGKWRQEGYAGEKTTRILVPSDAWNQLLDNYQDLNKLVTHEEPVVVKLGETWYDIRRAPPAPESTPETSPESSANQGR